MYLRSYRSNLFRSICILSPILISFISNGAKQDVCAAILVIITVLIAYIISYRKQTILLPYPYIIGL
ncbi:MAG: hypothetical protein ABII23_08840, partial [bacterium]